jgi:hypothetical protein
MFSANDVAARTALLATLQSSSSATIRANELASNPTRLLTGEKRNYVRNVSRLPEPRRITVNTVAAGPTETEMLASLLKTWPAEAKAMLVQRTPLGRTEFVSQNHRELLQSGFAAQVCSETGKAYRGGAAGDIDDAAAVGKHSGGLLHCKKRAPRVEAEHRAKILLSRIHQWLREERRSVVNEDVQSPESFDPGAKKSAKFRRSSCLRCRS